MKKLITALAIVAALFVAGKAQAQFSVNLGFAPEVFKTDIHKDPTGMPLINTRSEHGYGGYYVGATYNFNLTENLGIAVGGQLRWDRENKSKSIFGTLEHRHIENLFLVEVPIMLNYSINLNRDWKITPFIGPMLSYGLGGNIKICDQDYSNATTYPWYGTQDWGYDYNRLNLYGVGGLVVNYSHFNLSGGYRYGLLDLDSNDISTVHTSGFFVGLGYTF